MEPTQPPSGRSGRIGPYRVVKTIGTGGMAEVLKVEDTRTGQYRALKLHYVPTTDEAIYLNYRRENRAMARCDHPNVIRSYEYGVHEERPYLVMDFIPGVPLTDFLEERDLSPGPERDKMAALLGIQIASALDHIHSRNLVHRDLKPANILVTSDESVKLIDFGIAQDMGQDAAPTDGDVVGTYAFCSPEQVSGIQCDHRSDLYSFGVVLYLLITNQLPFVAEQAVAYILKHVNQPPEPPETYYPGIPPQLRDVILKLLQKKPVDRPQSGRDVEQVLKAYVEGLTQERKARVPLETDGATHGRRLYEPAFIGRERERAALEGAVTLLQAGAGGLVMVLGEIGYGKARLMDEVLADARTRGVTVFSGSCLPASDQPYQGLSELVEGVVGALAGHSSELLQMGGHLPVLARIFPAVATLTATTITPVDESDPRIEFERLQVALKAFLEASLTGPTVFELKDLQWTDPATMALIASISTEPRGPYAPPILWLGSVSIDELADEHPLWAWLRNPPLTAELITVAPLEVEEVDSMVRSMLGGTVEIGPLAAALHRESKGNPSFIAETVKGLVERGVLRSERGDGDITGWTIALPADGSPPVALVRTIQETLADRLAPLSPEALDMLERMAVLGRPCGFDWLRLTTRLPEEPLLDIIDDVLARRILVERKGRHSSLFSFFHPKMADVVAQRIDATPRVTLHREAAEAWLQVYGDGDASSVELLASQLFLARAYDKAAPYLLRAAESRLRLGLHDVGLKLLERALECCKQDPFIDQRIYVTTHLRLGQVLSHVGELEKGLTHLRAAYVGSQQNGFPEMQGQAMYVLARLTSGQGDFVSSTKHYAEALKLQRQCQDHPGLIRSLNGLAGSLWYLGDLPHSRKLFEESVASSKKLGDSGLLAQAVSGLGLVAMLEGRLAEASRHFEDATNLSRAGGRDAFYLLCQLNEADVLRMQGALGPAQVQAGAVVEKLERMGEREGLAAGLNTLAAIALEIRDLERAEKLLVKSGELLQSVPHRYARAVRQMLVGQFELVRGRPVEAQLGLTEALNEAETHQYRELVARSHRLLAAALIQCGSTGEGLGLMRRAVAEADKLSNLPGSAEGKLFYAEGLIIQGDKGEALTVLEPITRSFREMGTRLLLIRALVLGGRLSFEQGLQTGATAQLEEALSLSREVRNGLTLEERVFFDARPEIKLLSALWRMLPAQAPQPFAPGV